MAAATSDPPGPGSSRPPLCHVGSTRSASSTAVTPPSLMPPAPGPGYVDRPSTILDPKPGVGDGLEAGVDGEGEGIDHEPAPEPRPADPAEDGAVLVARRGEGERGTGRTGSGTRSTGSTDPVSSKRGSHTSSRCSKRTATSWPMATSPGSHPTMLVVRRTRGSSASATLAITYGGSKAGSHRWALTVKPTIVPRPDTAVGFQDRLRHEGQRGTGGCTSSPHSAHPWIRNVPSAPEVQNHSLAGVSSGSGYRGRPPGIDIDVAIEHARTC